MWRRAFTRLFQRRLISAATDARSPKMDTETIGGKRRHPVRRASPSAGPELTRLAMRSQ